DDCRGCAAVYTAGLKRDAQSEYLYRCTLCDSNGSCTAAEVHDADKRSGYAVFAALRKENDCILQAGQSLQSVARPGLAGNHCCCSTDSLIYRPRSDNDCIVLFTGSTFIFQRL